MRIARRPPERPVRLPERPVRVGIAALLAALALSACDRAPRTMPQSSGDPAAGPDVFQAPRRIEGGDRRDYAEAKKAAAERRTAAAAAGEGGDVEAARRAFCRAVRDDIIPPWLGTGWDFNGTTETPGEGKIACGYFVTTVLRDAGLDLERVRLAQAASESMIKTLVSAGHIKRFSDMPIADFTQAVRDWGSGIYVVGLDSHTGFIIADAEGVLFVHSCNWEPCCVIAESADTSPILAKSRYRVLGNLSADAELMRKWRDGEAVR
ncbi:MAG: hypothetical protein R3F11_04165 [Verrucomicrobiales bacterium]